MLDVNTNMSKNISKMHIKSNPTMRIQKSHMTFPHTIRCHSQAHVYSACDVNLIIKSVLTYCTCTGRNFLTMCTLHAQLGQDALNFSALSQSIQTKLRKTEMEQ